MSSNCIDLYEKTHLSDLVPLVAFLVPEMDDSIIQYYLRLSIINFARKTRMLRRRIEFDTYDNTNEYFINTNDDYRVFKLLELRHNGCCLVKNTSCDCVCGRYKYHEGKIILCDSTCKGDELIAEVIVTPSLNSCYIDSDLVEIWNDAIIEGFKANIYAGNDERWKNMTDSRLARREFDRIADRARAEALMSNVSKKVVRITS